MKEDSTTFGLKPDKLAELWKVGDDVAMNTDTPNQNELRADLLRDRLAQKLPLDQVVARILPKALSQVCEEIQPFDGNSFGLLLNDPSTDITIIKGIKDNSKKRSQHVSSESEQIVMAVIYYAAIASALVYHGQQITSFSYHELHEKYESLLEHKWLTPDLQSLFREARDRCVDKETDENGNAR